MRTTLLFVAAVALGSMILAPKLAVAQKVGTVPTDRALVDCNIQQTPAKSGSKPPEALATKLIQCLFEKPAAPGMDGAQTMDIGELQIGKPRKWNPRIDMGSGSVDTVVYPIRVKWTWKTFYRTATNVEANREDVFNCYVDAFERWTCGLGERVKEGAKSRVEKR